MTKTFCDVCGKEVKTWHGIYVDIDNKLGFLPRININHYYVCPDCASKILDLFAAKKHADDHSTPQ